ncbi:hypothetical protein M501DRAFT_1010235 [Patellaria atrata CBS 101060]|uniref:Fe2OG dioxygenase domain-containing protein n=1 Tax=Patellaria atrata CBS 101060 TaxID=1346257 RepID=A0A9P4VQL9_9PEZI|nr:hypothetical protein M501DRAFT_1010235 [Patellaria atrata CBS 101060]
MTSLLDLLTQAQPQFTTNQALLVVDLQNDFCSPDGKLPNHGPSGLVERIKALVPTFRENAGDVIWVRSVFEEERDVSDPSGDRDGDTVLLDVEAPRPSEDYESPEETSSKDRLQVPTPSSKPEKTPSSNRALKLFKRVRGKPKATPAPAPVAREPSPVPTEEVPEEDELFLSKTSKRGPCCLRDTPGVEFVEAVQATIDPENDVMVVKSHYSALNSTTLLLTLRTRLITELYICGNVCNTSIYATALDAARHGLTIHLIEDCLGYRKQMRYNEAIKQMTDLMGAQMITSQQIIYDLLYPSESEEGEEEDETAIGAESATEQLQAMLSNMSLTRGSAKDLRSKGGSLSESVRPPTASSSKRRQDTLSIESSDKISVDSKVSTMSPEELFEHDLRVHRQELKAKKSQPVLQPKKSEGRLRTVRSKARMRQREETEEKSKSFVTAADARSPKDSPRSSLNQAYKTTAAARASPMSPRSSDPQPKSSKKLPASLATFKTLGPGEKIGEGDCRIIYDFMPEDLTFQSFSETASRTSHYGASLDLSGRNDIFYRLLDEVRWQKMYHAQGEVPRLVCVEGEFGPDGSMPVYRHPSDQSLPLLHLSPVVRKVRDQVETIVRHPVNHVLIQLYRSGQDYISEHSDKTLDIVRGSSIVNVSFGAQRTMRLRTKKSAKSKKPMDEHSRETQRVSMPHNSIFVLGPETNMRWLHGINADKRIADERSDAELAYSGMRISLTFRYIGTFLSADNRLIWGQGATAKTQDTANPVINDDAAQTDNLIHAFGTENQSTDFDWDKTYGTGSDVLHFRAPPPDIPILFPGSDEVENSRVRIFLAEIGKDYTTSAAPPEIEGAAKITRTVTFRDADTFHTEILEAIPVLLYGDRYFHLDPSPQGHLVTASAYDMILKTEILNRQWIHRNESMGFIHTLRRVEEDLRSNNWEYICGNRFSVTDCAFWPVLDRVVAEWDGWTSREFPKLTEYYEMLWNTRPSVRGVREKIVEIE